MVRKENHVAVPTINLEALYDAYDSDHISLVEAVTQAAAMVQMQPEGFEVDSLRIMDYDTTKHKLWVCPDGGSFFGGKQCRKEKRQLLLMI